MKILTWSPTISYALIALAVCLIHGNTVQPIVDKLAIVEQQFVQTHEGLKRGEQLSQEGQIEMNRMGAHHVLHAKEYVQWTQGWVWLLTMPGILAAGLQGWVLSRSSRKRQQNGQL